VDISRAAAKALAQDQCAQLLQITREALSNIVRHAHAKSARIALKQRGKTIRLDISDDGKGFDTGAQNGPGLGLHHISARVQRLGGALHLESKPRGGCRVVVELAA
jgi:two-component system nitrate/nitrite sensor histidine kinase NarX